MVCVSQTFLMGIFQNNVSDIYFSLLAMFHLKFMFAILISEKVIYSQKVEKTGSKANIYICPFSSVWIQEIFHLGHHGNTLAVSIFRPANISQSALCFFVKSLAKPIPFSSFLKWRHRLRSKPICDIREWRQWMAEVENRVTRSRDSRDIAAKCKSS